ncbi:MAG: hypothetical protein HQL23_03060 [Candidatus Omnitrophica bacterium]|nr:hypothetical protein [Candidatus Omnitrophota bacterium]
MAFQPLNLIHSDFPASDLFKHLPRFDAIYYQGLQQENVQRYSAVREGQECRLFVVTLIRKDEDFLWDSAKDLLDRSMKQAAPRMRGVYQFDLLTFDFHREKTNFSDSELAQMIFNASFKIKPGEQRLIRYSLCYGLLQKMLDESWGKIIFKTAVEIFNDKPSFLYALVSRILKPLEFSREPVIVLVNDLSAHPLYNAQDNKQQTFLRKLIVEQAKQSIEFPPEVYVQNVNGVRELLSGSVIEGGQ